MNRKDYFANLTINVIHRIHQGSLKLVKLRLENALWHYEQCQKQFDTIN